MAQASTTLLIKTEGVTEGYKDIGKLLGPLQGINHMLYNLNKALGISTKESKTYKESLTGATNAGKAAATETKKLQQNLRNAAKAAIDLSKSGETVSKAFNFNQLRQAFSTVKNDIKLVVAEVYGWIEAAEKQAQAEGTLQNTLSRLGIKNNINDWREWASELQRTTTLGDETILQLANIATQFTKNSKSAKDLTKASMDMAAATGGNAQEAMNALLRAASGSDKALKAYGVYLSDAEKETLKTASASEKLELIISKAQKQYVGFSEALANTPEGAIKQVKNIIGDIKERLGNVLNLPFVAYVKSIALGMQRVLSLTKMETNDLKLAGQITTIMGKSLNVLPNILQNITAGAKGLFFVFKGLMEAVNFMKLGIAGFGGLIAKITNNAGMLRDMLDLGTTAEKNIAAYEQMYQNIGQGLDNFSAQLDGLNVEMESTFANSINAQNSITITQKWADDLQAGMDKAGDIKVKVKPEVENLDLTNMFAGQVFDLNSLEMISEQAFKIKQEYNDKLLNLEKVFLEQKKALDTMLNNAGDDPNQLQWIRDQQLAIEQQFEEQKYQLKIQYAQQTNDQLTLLQDKYYTHVKKKEAEFEQITAEWQNNMKANLEGGLTDAFNNMFDAAMEGTDSLRESMYNSMKSLAKNIFNNSLSAIVKYIVAWATAAGESQAGIPVVGPALAAAASAAVLATMGIMKAKAGKEAKVQYAHGGYVSAGMVRGYSNTKKDSVSALLAPGERVLSAKEAKKYEERITNTTENAINITLNAGMGTDKVTLQNAVRQLIIPELRRAQKQGYAI